MLMRLVRGLFIFVLSQALWAGAQLDNVRIGATTDHTRVVLDLDAPVQRQVMTLANPDRLVLDLEDTSLNGPLTQPGGQDKFLQHVRGARHNGKDYRVVLDLKGQTAHDIFYLKPEGANGHRLVIDLSGPVSNTDIDPPLSAEAAAPAVLAPPVSDTTVASAAESDMLAANQPATADGDAPPPATANTVAADSPAANLAMGTAHDNRSAGATGGLGGFYPDLQVSVTHDDNLLRGVPGTELDTFIYNVSPSLNYVAKDSVRSFTAGWRLNAGYHDASSTDDYVDNTLDAKFEYTPTSRTRLGIGGEYLDSHDPRGTGRAEGVAIGGFQQTYDEWHQFSVAGNMAYGVDTAQARVEGDAGYITKTYDNNRLFTATRDRDDTYAAGRLFYQVGPKTSLVAEGRVTDYAYQTTSPLASSLDSQDYQVSGGVTWKALNKTTGTVKLGYLTKTFDAAGRADGNAFNWDVEVEWRPRTYSVVALSTSRQFDETNGTGNFIERDNYAIAWTHDWGNQVSTTADFSYSNDSFAPTTREDDLLDLGVRVNYAMRRWLTLSAGYRYEDRDSNRNAFDYQRNLILFTADFALDHPR